MANEPSISWYEGKNATTNEVTTTINYGTIDADSDSPQKTFYIWNNRNGDVPVSKIEEVTFTTRDRLGGTGDAPVVEAVRDNWFQVRVDSLDEGSFTAVGKTFSKPLGTNGTTQNPNFTTATKWTESTLFAKDTYVKPTVGNGFIYLVTSEDGTSDVTEPSWSTTENNSVSDGTVEYKAIKVEQKPAAHEILGVANDVLADGSDAENAGGNFVKITVYAEVPITAKAGKNLLTQRISYRYV